MSNAAFTVTTSADPTALLLPLPATNTLRGNPNLAPRRGARTRAGCPCRSPAIHGKLRCPAGQARGQAPHGGRSPDPGTPETLPRRRPGSGIRVRDARTVRDRDGANASADNRHASPCSASAGSTSPSTFTRPACRPRPPPNARRKAHRRPVQPYRANNSVLIPIPVSATQRHQLCGSGRTAGSRRRILRLERLSRSGAPAERPR